MKNCRTRWAFLRQTALRQRVHKTGVSINSVPECFTRVLAFEEVRQKRVSPGSETSSHSSSS